MLDKNYVSVTSVIKSSMESALLKITSFLKTEKTFCSACCVDASPHELRYNPFDLITSKNQTDKFYDTEPVEFDP